MSINYGRVPVGNITTSLSPNTLSEIRLGNMGEQITSSLNGSYYESNYRKQLFTGAIVAQVTTVGLATTYTGLCLSNPIGSPVNLVLLKAGFGFTVVFPAVATIGLMTGSSLSANVTHTTPVTPKSQFIGAGTVGYGTLDSAATLSSTPVVNTILGAGLTGAATTIPSILGSIVDLEGSIILSPGAYCAFYTSTVSGAAGGNFSFCWQEIPI